MERQIKSKHYHSEENIRTDIVTINLLMNQQQQQQQQRWCDLQSQVGHKWSSNI